MRKTFKAHLNIIRHHKKSVAWLITGFVLGTLFTLGGVLYGWQFVYLPGAQTTVTIGWIGPLTGPVSFLGQENLRAVTLAIEDYNADRPDSAPAIKLVFADDIYQPETAVKAYEAMMKKNRPIAVFVNTYSAMFPIAERAAADDVIIINPIDNDQHLSQLGENIFLIAKHSEQLGKVIAEDIIKTKAESVLVCYNNADDFMPAIAFGLQKSFKEAKISVMIHDYNSLESSRELSRHTSMAQAMKPDAIVFLGYAEAGILMHEYRKLGLDGFFYTVNDAAKATSQGALEGSRILYFTAEDGRAPFVEDFLDSYQKRYHEGVVNYWVAFQAYDASSILIEAVKKNPAALSSVEILRNALLEVKDFEGISGIISIDASGSSTGIGWSMYHFEDGALTKSKKVD